MGFYFLFQDKHDQDKNFVTFRFLNKQRVQTKKNKTISIKSFLHDFGSKLNCNAIRKEELAWI